MYVCIFLKLNQGGNIITLKVIWAKWLLNISCLTIAGPTNTRAYKGNEHTTTFICIHTQKC